MPRIASRVTPCALPWWFPHADPIALGEDVPGRVDVAAARDSTTRAPGEAAVFELPAPGCVASLLESVSGNVRKFFNAPKANPCKS